MKTKLGDRDLPISLGTPGVGTREGFVRFTWAAQKDVAIKAVVLKSVAGDPLDVAVGVEIVKHRPEAAKVTTYEDGSTVSDLGISSVTYAMRSSSKDVFVTPIPTEEEVRLGHGGGSNWFVEDGVGYLLADLGDRVVVHVMNHAKNAVELTGVILYRDVTE